MRIPALGSRLRRAVALALIPAVGLVAAACGEQPNQNQTSDEAAPNLFGETSNGIGFPHEVVTEEGIASASLYLPIFLIAVAIFILIEGLLLFMTWRFRRKGDDADLPEQTHGNNALEVVWTAIPAFIVTVLFIGSAMVLVEVESKVDDPAVVIDVDAFQFGWAFHYMDPDSYDEETQKYEPSGITVSFSPSLASADEEDLPGERAEAVVPIDVPIRFRLNALDVIHSFYVPAFFYKKDAIPGRINEFEITIEEPGVYGGQCAEFCGLSHGRMFFNIHAVEQAEYNDWIAEQGGAAALTAAIDLDTTDAESDTETSDAQAETDGSDEMSEEAA